MHTIMYRITHVGDLQPKLLPLEDAIGAAISVANDAENDASMPRIRKAVGEAINHLYAAHAALDDTRRLSGSDIRWGIRSTLDDTACTGRDEELVLGYEKWGDCTIVQRQGEYVVLGASGIVIGMSNDLAGARDAADAHEERTKQSTEAAPVATATPKRMPQIALGSLAYGDPFTMHDDTGVHVYRKGKYSGQTACFVCHRGDGKEIIWNRAITVYPLPVTGVSVPLSSVQVGGTFKREATTMRTYRKGESVKRGKEYTRDGVLGTDVEDDRFVALFGEEERVFVPN